LKILKVKRIELVTLRFGEFLGELKTKKLANYSANMTFEALHSRDSDLQLFAFQDRNIIEVHDVKLDTKTGMMFNRRNQIIEDSSSWSGAQLMLNSVPRPLWPRKLELSKERQYILLPGNSFYHWLIEDLAPFLFALQETVNPTVIVCRDAPSYVHEFAHSLSGEVVKVPRFLALDRYIFTTRNPSSGWPEPVDIKVLREHFSQAIASPEIGKKIYVSRLKSARSPWFEKQLMELLQDDGWLILYTEEMMLFDQIKTISSASIVCGVGGAGLAHITWLGEGARVIELSPNWYVPCFSRLSQLLGIEYSSIFFEDKSLSAAEVHMEICSIINSTA